MVVLHVSLICYTHLIDISRFFLIKEEITSNVDLLNISYCFGTAVHSNFCLLRKPFLKFIMNMNVSVEYTI